MTIEEALELRITEGEAIRELRRHGVAGFAYSDGPVRKLTAVPDGGDKPEVIAIADEFGDFIGGDVLAWLGY